VNLFPDADDFEIKNVFVAFTGLASAACPFLGGLTKRGKVFPNL
jgi:hypothetical protein